MNNMVLSDAMYQTDISFVNSIRVIMLITRYNQANSSNTGMWTGSVFSFLNRSNVHLLSTSSAQKKSDPFKGKYVSSDLRIIYPSPEIKNPNLNFKLCWIKILPLAPRNYFLLVPTWIFLGIGGSRRFFWGILLWFYLLGFIMLLLFWGTPCII